MEHDKMWSGADLRGGSPLVSFDHVIDPHVVISSTLYTTISNPNATLTIFLTLNPALTLTCNPTVTTYPQIGPINPQIVTIQICPAPDSDKYTSVILYRMPENADGNDKCFVSSC